MVESTELQLFNYRQEHERNVREYMHSAASEESLRIALAQIECQTRNAKRGSIHHNIIIINITNLLHKYLGPKYKNRFKYLSFN